MDMDIRAHVLVLLSVQFTCRESRRQRQRRSLARSLRQHHTPLVRPHSRLSLINGGYRPPGAARPRPLRLRRGLGKRDGHCEEGTCAP